MKKYLISLFLFGSILAQSSPFQSYDVVLYPEYYFNGIMVEIEGEVKQDSLPLDLKVQVPVNTDSVFFVTGNVASNANVIDLQIKKEQNLSFINTVLLDPNFRIFIFYDIKRNKQKRSGVFSFSINHPIDDAHIVVQEPIVAEDFVFSEKNAEVFKDQHGMNFKRVHLNNYLPKSVRKISFSYLNPSNDISINLLQSKLSDNPNPPADIPFKNNSAPIRHKLPLWQPLFVLSIVSIAIGVMFYFQMKKEKIKSKSFNNSENSNKFCTHCGSGINIENKFCANCGGEL